MTLTGATKGRKTEPLPSAGLRLVEPAGPAVTDSRALGQSATDVHAGCCGSPDTGWGALGGMRELRRQRQGGDGLFSGQLTFFES